MNCLLSVQNSMIHFNYADISDLLVRCKAAVRNFPKKPPKKPRDK